MSTQEIYNEVQKKLRESDTEIEPSELMKELHYFVWGVPWDYVPTKEDFDKIFGGKDNGNT